MDELERLETVAAVFDQMPLLMAVTEGPDQRLVALNELGRETIGDRTLGEPIEAWLTELPGQQLIERYREAWRTGVPYAGREWRLEVQDQGGRMVESFYDFTLTPVARDDGSVRAVVIVGEDVTERVRAREDARAHTLEAEERSARGADLAVQLQDALLPDGLPVLQGAVVSARYLLTEAAANAGGDWFDAATLDDGRVALSVGDVVGHGVDASVTMGELRTVFDDRIRDGGDLEPALSALDRHARRMPHARAATVCAAVLDPRTGDLSYCTAGHPPPMVLRRDGTATFLDSSGASPLCVDGAGYEPCTEHLDPGDLVLFYSDGLVERPGRTPAQNTVELLRIAEDVMASADAGSAEPLVDEVCRRTLELMTRVTGYHDDITVLAIQRTAPVPQLSVTLPAMADTVRAMRLDLGAWLAGLHLSALDELTVQHAVGELVTNAVEHAYDVPGAQDQVRLTARLDPDGHLEVEVADDGCWRERPVRQGGRGLALARGLVDRVVLLHGDRGTVARVEHRPSRPVGMLHGVTVRPALGLAAERFAVTVAGDTVTCTGPVDAEGAVHLARTLEHIGRAGTAPVTIDLAAVTLLTSAGVQALADAHAAGPVRLLAPAGCPAQHVLELVHLPYEC